MVVSFSGSPTIRDPFGNAIDNSLCPSPRTLTPSRRTNSFALRKNSPLCRAHVRHHQRQAPRNRISAMHRLRRRHRRFPPLPRAIDNAPPPAPSSAPEPPPAPADNPSVSAGAPCVENKKLRKRTHAKRQERPSAPFVRWASRLSMLWSAQDRLNITMRTMRVRGSGRGRFFAGHD
jgi:hypothetical protein